MLKYQFNLKRDNYILPFLLYINWNIVDWKGSIKWQQVFFSKQIAGGHSSCWLSVNNLMNILPVEYQISFHPMFHLSIHIFQMFTMCIMSAYNVLWGLKDSLQIFAEGDSALHKMMYGNYINDLWCLAKFAIWHNYIPLCSLRQFSNSPHISSYLVCFSYVWLYPISKHCILGNHWQLGKFHFMSKKFMFNRVVNRVLASTLSEQLTHK